MQTFRHILGYLIGFSAFCLLIPYLLVMGSRNLDLLPNLDLISNPFLRLVIALPLLGVGLLFAIWSNVFLYTKGLGGPVDVFNVAISPRSQKLVVTGPYRYCRNPMVFGALTIYISISIILNSFDDLLIILLTIPLVILYLKYSEEQRLIRDFGADFLSYRSKVPMIIPFTKIRKKNR